MERVRSLGAQGRRKAYKCGQWEADLERRELRARGVGVPLGGRAFDLMEVLVRSAGQLVSKDALVASVWAGAVVEENTIQVHISALRKALGADRHLLRTASGRGYCLLGDWLAEPDGTATIIDFPGPAIVAPSPKGNLPVAGSDLIGRSAAVLRLGDLLSAYRAVTLAGPGGIGKTRLALEVARRARPDFADDCWLVELAALVDPALVPSAVAATLGLELRGDMISPEAVARAIGGRKLLLVLDNCEHVIATAAPLAEAVLRLCPGITLLTTSREALNIDGEYVYRVAPLEVPSRETADVLACGAAQLLIARMQALGVENASDGTATSAIAAICRHLDGIPLAIELAAARAATLGLEHVLSRLGDRFGLLTGGRRTALPRHRTLRATLDWSYQLLQEPERRLLRRLAVFAGGFTLDGAAAVLGDGPDASFAVVDGIASLVAKSLVGLDDAAAGGRWRLLETTRAYALERLIESGEAADVSRRHADFFQLLFAPESVTSRLEAAAGNMPGDAREIDNVRAALEWAFSDDGNAGTAIGLTIGVVPLWVRLSLMGECRRWVERALASLGRDTDDVPRARMQLSAALGWSLMFAVGRSRDTGAAWTTTLELAEALDDTGYRVRAMWGLWVDRLNHGAFRKALELAQDFAATVKGSTDAIDLMMADRMLATSLHFLGDQRNAHRHIELMLGRYEMPTLEPYIVRFQFDQRVTAHYFQARILWLLGFADQAMRVVDRNIDEAMSLGNSLSLGNVLGQGACPIALFTGQIGTAERYGAMLLDHSDRHALRLWQAWVRAYNAVILVRQGDIARGLRILRDEIAQAAEARFLPRYVVLIGELARSLGLAGDSAAGLETADEAIGRCEAQEEGWYLPELLRIRGELIILTGKTDAAAIAEDHFLRALDRAGQQGALAWELRAATSLARLRRDRHRTAEARAVLSQVYGRFSEGFDTADLQDARRLLMELS